MAYQKQIWENLPSTNTPINADRLNHMEDGIEEAWQHGGGGAGETLPVGSEIDFDGQVSEIPTGWEQIPQKEYILATTTTASRTNPTKVVFNSIFSYTGNFTLYDGGVVIPAGISKVRVSANVFLEDAQATGYSICAIYLSRNGTETNQAQTLTPVSSGFYASSIISPTIVDVEEGDILYIRGDNPSNSKVRINRANTWILVEKYV